MLKNFKEFILERFFSFKSLPVSIGNKPPVKKPFIADVFKFEEKFIDFKRVCNKNLNDIKINDVKATSIRFLMIFDFNKKEIFTISWPSDVIHTYFMRSINELIKTNSPLIEKIPKYNYLDLYNNATNKKYGTILLFPGVFDGKTFSSSIDYESFNLKLEELSKSFTNKITLINVLNISNINDIKSSW